MARTRRRNPPAEFRPFSEITKDMGKGRPFSEYIEAVKGGRHRRRNPSDLPVGKLLVFGVLGYLGYQMVKGQQAQAAAVKQATSL